jgi:hypothetical protein
MKTFGELLFALALFFVAGNFAYKKAYKEVKKEAVRKVSGGLGSLQSFTTELTKK